MIFLRRNNMIVTGALTGKVMDVPVSNYGMSMEMFSDQVEIEGYPKKFTRILLKQALDGGVKFVDCVESVKDVATFMHETSGGVQ
jgi:hypothetical protein